MRVVQLTGQPVIVRQLGPDDWARFREIRLRALAEAPAAFSSTLAEALQLDEAAWRARLATRAQFLATVSSDAVGTAGGVVTDSGPELISMWVDPRVRGSGVGDQLVRAVLEWAMHAEYASVLLWVASGNEAAERLYARHGFRRTGASQPMTEGRPERSEIAMRRDLRRDQPTYG